MLNLLHKLLGQTSIDIEELLKSGAKILDVRNEYEIQSGAIQGAIHIPLNQVKARIDDLRKMQQPIIAVCKSGLRSSIAVNILKAQGIEAYNGGRWERVQQYHI